MEGEGEELGEREPETLAVEVAVDAKEVLGEDEPHREWLGEEDAVEQLVEL
jgi:hypothetical protein